MTKTRPGPNLRGVSQSVPATRYASEALPPENIYGHVKRLRWILSQVDRGATLVELGCGTGYMISRPLAKLGFEMHGVELDELCGVQAVPGILQWAEMGDVAGLIAPKPLLTESGQDDACFPWHGTEPTLVRLREIYHTAGAEDRLTVNVYDGEHTYYGAGVPEFWDRWL